MVRVLEINTSSFARIGIATQLLSCYKHIDPEEVTSDFIANRNVDYDLVHEYEELGFRVIKLSSRDNSLLSYFIDLVKLIKKERYDIVRVHGSSSLLCIELLAAKIGGVKVRIAHSRNTQCDHPKIHWLLMPAFNRLYTDAFACGEDAGKFLFPAKEFVVIQNGKDFKTFKYDEELRSEARVKLGLEGKIVFGHVGSLNRQKNHQFLLQIFSEIKKETPNSILYLMGDGSLKSELEETAVKLGIRDAVVFAGMVDDVSYRLQAMDVMIFPSLFEGLPNVVLEWQAVGLPSLISDTITRECAPSDLVEFMSLNSSANEWADKAVQLAQNNCNRTLRANKATEDLKNAGFDIRKNAMDLVERYENLCARGYQR